MAAEPSDKAGARWSRAGSGNPTPYPVDRDGWRLTLRRKLMFPMGGVRDILMAVAPCAESRLGSRAPPALRGLAMELSFERPTIVLNEDAGGLTSAAPGCGARAAEEETELAMSNPASANGFRTSVTATLSVRDWPRAIDFYKR